MRRTILVAVLSGLVGALIAVPVVVYASHSFNDVPNTNTFHNDIAWLKEADVTRGCNPPDNSLFCPKDNVTREQMAAFMRRLAENRVVDAGSLQGLDASTFYTTDEVDAKLGSPTHIGNHNGVGNNAGCAGGELSVVITDATGNPRDARFSFQLGDNEAYGQIRSGASIRIASPNVTNVVHEPGTGIYCIQFIGTTSVGRESAVMSLHAETFPRTTLDEAETDSLPGND